MPVRFAFVDRATPQEIALDYARRINPLFPESSLNAAMENLQDVGVAALPILLETGELAIVREEDVRKAMLAGASPFEPAAGYCSRDTVMIAPDTGFEAMSEIFRERGIGEALIVDAEGRYGGMVFALDLFLHRMHEARPGLVGGLATPFGVYLTNGVVSGGARGIALAATGAMLTVLFTASVLATLGLLEFFSRAIGTPGAAKVMNGDVDQVWITVVNSLPVLLFLLFIRAIPLSGTHAAEHMVVHAIERREPLTYEVVRRMPRVHPRCGTNIAVGAVIFLWLMDELPYEYGALIALAATIMLWRTVGGLVQYWFTTKPTSRAQLENAIGAGKELIVRYRSSRRLAPSFGQRVLNTGLPWVLAGGLAASGLVYLISVLLGDPLRVF